MSGTNKISKEEAVTRVIDEILETAKRQYEDIVEEPSPHRKHQLILTIVGIRKKKGLSVAELAHRMGCETYKVEEIEACMDHDELTLGCFRQYVEALGFKVVVRIEHPSVQSASNISKG